MQREIAAVLLAVLPCACLGATRASRHEKRTGADAARAPAEREWYLRGREGGDSQGRKELDALLGENECQADARCWAGVLCVRQ